MAGQELVLSVLTAVMRSPAWKKSLLVITYDEHGGFYDHVDPRPFTVADDRPAMRRYGVRVPALVVSPYVERGVSHVVYDHTSIIKTILVRFCSRPDTAVRSMGARLPQPTIWGRCSPARRTGHAGALPTSNCRRWWRRSPPGGVRPTAPPRSERPPPPQRTSPKRSRTSSRRCSPWPNGYAAPVSSRVSPSQTSRAKLRSR